MRFVRTEIIAREPMHAGALERRYKKLAFEVSRTFSCFSTLYMKRWREQRGLPINKNAEGVLTDAPDFTYIDGRPTPLLHKQKQRMLRQQEFASKIVELSGELRFAQERERKILAAKAEERENILSNRLKPKGLNLLKKH